MKKDEPAKKQDQKSAAKTDDKKQTTRIVDDTVFTITVPWKVIEQEMEKAVQELAPSVSVQGFRQGKVPPNIAKNHIDAAKLRDEALSHILPSLYAEEAKKRTLHPVTMPRFNGLDIADNKDWTIEVRVAEKPPVVLGEYKKAVTEVNKKHRTSIITDTSKPAADKQQQDKEMAMKRQEQLQESLKTLLEVTEIDLPQLLVQDEAQRTISQLIEQLNHTGMKIQDFLRSTNRTEEQLRNEHVNQAIANLKLNFVLDAIQAEEKIMISDKEIDDTISFAPKEELARLNEHASRHAIQDRLQRQKTVDFLLSM